MFMIVVDAFSKWVEIAVMRSTTTEAVIRELQILFATHGLPDLVVTDNGPQLTAGAFGSYLTSLGIRHCLIAPYHPAANGLAERAVRSAKEALARMGPGGWPERVAEYLLVQHTTPRASNNLSPAEMLMGRRLRTTLDRLHPAYAPVKPLDSRSSPRPFTVGQAIYAHNFGSWPLWVPGKIVRITGPCSYKVDVGRGFIWRRHQDQLRSRTITSGVAERGEEPSRNQVGEGLVELGENDRVLLETQRDSERENISLQLRETEDQQEQEQEPVRVHQQEQEPVEVQPDPQFEGTLRRSQRERHWPEHLRDYICAIPGERGVMY